MTIRDVTMGGQLIYVCNDWPCTLLPFWKEYYKSKGRSLDLHCVKKRKKITFESAWDKSRLLFRWMDEVENMEARGNLKDEGLEMATALTAVAQKSEDNVAHVDESSALCPHPVKNGGYADSTSAEQLCIDEWKWRAEQTVRLSQAKSVFVIHNMEFTGPNLSQSLAHLDLERDLALYLPSKSQGNWLEAGLFMSDSVVTVSPEYARELQAEFEFSHSAVLRNLKIMGIMNGLDTETWTPSRDPLLSSSLHYTPHDLPQGKNRAKLHLQRKLGLSADVQSPVFGFVGRLDHQKGVDILLTAILKCFTDPQMRYNAQFVMLGCGDRTLAAHLKAIKYWFPGFAAGVASFDNTLAHEILAGSDFLLVPSRFEPCGLVGLAAVRYGTLPIAPAIGGLKELVQVDRFGFPPLGIKIEDASLMEHPLYEMSGALHKAILQAMNLYGSAEFLRLQRRCMFSDVSWDRPVLEWINHLESLLEG